MAALPQQTKGNSLLSRFKAFLAFQKYKHTFSQDRRRRRRPADMGSDSVVETGEIDFSKWRKLDSRNFGISSSRIPASPWIVLKVLQSQGFEAYLVGGCVRDLILNRIPKDFDVITTARLSQIRRHFHRAEIVGRRFPICRVHVKGSVVEVSSFDTVAKQTGKREELFIPKMPKGFHKKDFILWKNSMHRDFTVNSLFFDPSVNRIYDYADAMVDLKSLQLRTLVPAHLSFEQDCARMLRGLRLAARLKLSFSKDIENAMHKLSSSIMRLDKSRLMMEVNYMLSYGAAEPSLSLLQRYNILEMLLPFHAAHLTQQSNKQLGESSAMLMKLFSSLDQLVTCGRPSHDSLWVALLAFHLALITKPQQAFVVLAFASVLYHGNWKEGVKFAKKHSDAAAIYAPEISDSQGSSTSDDELADRVTELALLVKNSLDILTDKDSLQEAMSKFPGSPCSGLVFVSKKMGKGVEVIFDMLVEDVTSLKTRRNSFEIDYTLLGKGQMRETRFVLGQIILDTIGPGIIPGGEVIKNEKHTLVKLDAQSSVDDPRENIGGNVELKKRNFQCEDDNQPTASYGIKHNRAEKRKLIQKGSFALEEVVTKKQKSVIAQQSKDKAVEKQDLIEYKESLEQKLDNGDALSKKKTKGEHSELPQDEIRMVLEEVKHKVPRHKNEQKGGNKYQQTAVNHLKLLLDVDNGVTSKQDNSKEKSDPSQKQNEERNESLDRRKQNPQGCNLASDKNSKPKAGKRTLSSLFR
ncbi:PREDICTED: uncharacterized protein LOC109218546 isoform X1 [Nicotiana attenuata]|uniref:Uncharacterized protein n=1 Tax=Nicotiana attenuata TaxID=49451 RepID=A0A1J6JX69_NICAT|nr:PREDICTED: uncharacterized protein LOC109218546 isoform X1 [Nicotiana attenuata]OIT21718.1 hypothetical protein A4A49_34364 [Nicotiana attenuata]